MFSKNCIENLANDLWNMEPEKSMFKIILQTLPVLIFSYTAQVFMKKGAASLNGVNWEKVVTHPFNARLD
jgi:hypothetical protein